MDVVRGRVCFYSQSALDERGAFASDKKAFCSDPDRSQKKPPQYGTKKAVQTMCNGCESRLQVTLMRKKDGAQPCLFSYLSYKEDIVKNGQLGDRFTA